MRLNKIIVTGVAAVFALAMAGCGSAAGASSSAGETAPFAATDDSWMEAGPGGADTTASEAMTAPSTDAADVENSLSKYAGAYSDENGKGYAILLTFTDDESGVYVTASHMNEEEQTYYRWDAFGDIQGSVISYNNAVCLKMVLDPQSETGIREETVYSDGKGTMEITKDDKIIWKDEKVNDGEEIVLAWDQTLTDEVQEQAQTGQN